MLGAIIANEKYKKRGRTEALFSEESDNEDYRTLQKRGLLSIMWADDCPYYYSPTDEERSYIEGWFLDELEKMTVINNNTNTNEINGVTSTSQACANYEVAITLPNVITAIASTDLDAEIKQKAMSSASELEEAAKQKNAGKFFVALERMSSIAKSTAELGKQYCHLSVL